MSQSSFTPPPGLVQLGGTPSLRRYVAELWERRAFAITNATGELRAQHMNTTLGNLWHLLNPILLIAVYYLVFGILLNTRRGAGNFIGFLSIGIFTYQWATKTITGGARAIVSNEGLIRSLQFPRALLPVSSVLREVVAFGPGLVVMLALMLVTGEGITPRWMLIIPAAILQIVFGLGAAFLAARAADRFRDTLNLLPFLFRLAFYGSGILYAVDERFHDAFENPWVIRFFIANPFYCLVSLWRDALMTSQEISHMPALWISASVWACALLVVGLLVFRGGEKEYGRG